MKNKEYKNIEDYPEDWEPDWLDPANDRKTPYTDEELKEFAQGFTDGMSKLFTAQSRQNVAAVFGGIGW